MPIIVMPDQVYEVVAQAARYWFLFLMVMIAWRSYRWLARDRKQRKKRLRLLPDAGFIGEMVVQKGNEDLAPGEVLPVPREGVLGAQRSADLSVPVRGVFKRHLWFRFEEGKGLRVKTFGKHPMEVDGEAYGKRGSEAYLSHGSRLQVGDAVLRLRMFAGFEGKAKPKNAPYADDRAQGDAQQAAMTPEQMALWQQQYWMMAQQAMMMQAMQAQQNQNQGKPNPEGESAQEEDLEINQDMVFEEHADAFEDEELDEDALEAEERARAGYTILTEDEPMEEPLDRPEGEEPWPYAPFPQSNAVFENQGYTYPEYVEDVFEDEDLTDAAAPPKSLYVEEDEAEQAKRILWDKYLGGGKKR